MPGTQTPSMSKMHVFVCYAFVENKMKLDPCSEEGIFVGYDSESPAYLVYSPINNGVKKIRGVKFNEKFKEVKTLAVVYEDNYAIEKEQERKSQTEELKIENASEQQQDKHPGQKRMKPKDLEDYICEVNQFSSAKFSVDYCYSATFTPATYKEAISTPDCEKWKRAMEDEIQGLEESDTMI